jgi:hypothetical protein
MSKEALMGGEGALDGLGEDEDLGLDEPMLDESLDSTMELETTDTTAGGM